MSSSAKSRNFRRRGEDDDTTTTTNDAQTKTTTPSTATVRKPSSSSSKPKKLLSFADDEDSDDLTTPSPNRHNSSKSTKEKTTSRFSSKQPSSSHKHTSSKDRIPPTLHSSTTTSNVQPRAGAYTKEDLLELQKNTRSLSYKPTSDKQHQEQPKVILRGLLKLNSSQAHEEEPSVVLPDGDDDTINSSGKSSSYPDEDTIQKIRAKRERLRQSWAAATDYISLDGGSNVLHGGNEGLSDEEPEFRTRIAMIGNRDTGISGRHGVFEDVDDSSSAIGDPSVDAVMMGSSGIGAVSEDRIGNGDYEDEEDKLWEEEQFRKGLGRRMDDGSGVHGVNLTNNTTSTDSMMHSQQQHQQQWPVPVGSLPSIEGAFGSSQPLDLLSIPQQAEVARKALQENIKKFEESHRRTISSLDKTNENLSASLMNIVALENSLAAAGEKFIFMQKLRDFVSVICEFLQHKAPFIEELEEQMQKLHTQRASATLDRRTADNDDEMMEIEAAVKAAELVFRDRGSSAAIITTATSAAEAALAALKEKLNLPPKLDEFGRDVNQQKRMDLKRRAEARQRRKAKFDSKRLSSMEVDSPNQKIEGESSTDESDSESMAYQSNRDLLLQTADQIFSDASEEYSQLSVVKERLERWKREYSASYGDAYMSLSVPAIFSPYVRLELLKWDPLHEDADFFDMKWHSLLYKYGFPEDGSDLSPDDADSNLVPELVEKVAIPILHHEITHCWDTFSVRETQNAVSATSLVTSYVPLSSEALTDLLVTIRARLAKAVAIIMVPIWSPLVLKAVPSAARIAAYRFGMSIRLMKNVCLWKDILALPVLEKLVIDELLLGKIVPHVRSIASNVHDAVTRTERIIATLPREWSGASATANHRRKMLQPLVDHVLLLGRTLEKKHVSGVTENETNGLARRLKKMLVTLNEYDKAREISQTFRLKEAL